MNPATLAIASDFVKAGIDKAGVPLTASLEAYLSITFARFMGRSIGVDLLTVRVTAALGKAFGVYTEAADALRRGRPVVALKEVDRIADVVADVALELATSCAEGQRSLVATELPDDLIAAAKLTPERDDDDDEALVL